MSDSDVHLAKQYGRRPSSVDGIPDSAWRDEHPSKHFSPNVVAEENPPCSERSDEHR